MRKFYGGGLEVGGLTESRSRNRNRTGNSVSSTGSGVSSTGSSVTSIGSSVNSIDSSVRVSNQGDMWQTVSYRYEPILL